MTVRRTVRYAWDPAVLSDRRFTIEPLPEHGEVVLMDEETGETWRLLPAQAEEFGRALRWAARVAEKPAKVRLKVRS